MNTNEVNKSISIDLLSGSISDYENTLYQRVLQGDLIAKICLGHLIHYIQRATDRSKKMIFQNPD